MAATAEGMSARLSSLKRITFVDIVLWGMRILIVFIVVGGTYGTLTEGRYTGEQWFDNVMFGLTIGGIYALIALGYTMVYGILRLINFAHGDITMTGAFTAYFLATSLARSGYLKCPSDPVHDHDHGGRNGGLYRDCPGSGAYLLPAVSPCSDACTAYLRYWRFVFSTTLIPRYVWLIGALLSRSLMAQWEIRDLRLHHAVRAAFCNPHRPWQRWGCSTSSCSAPRWVSRCVRFPKIVMPPP